MAQKGFLTIALAIAAVFLRSNIFVMSPLWLDYFKANNTKNRNMTSFEHTGNSALFFTVGNRVFSFVFYGIWLLLMYVCADPE